MSSTPVDIDAPLVEPATARALDAAMRTEPSRGHLGMSSIGGPCDRLLWLRFRWSLPNENAPRLLRVFKIGNLLEMAMADWLRNIPGVELHTMGKDGRQIGFSFFGGHFAGSLDGVVRGLPEAPKTWHVWECKTANTKRYAELMKVGIREWSPEYWAQAQCYMGAIGFERAIFTVINKDDASIYTERVQYDPMQWDAMLARAQRILQADQPPVGEWKSPDNWESKTKLNDSNRDIYFGRELPKPNCRNCRFSAPVLDGEGARWACAKWTKLLTIDEQRKGCDLHEYIIGLMPFECVGQKAGGMSYRRIDGSIFINGPVATEDTYSSNELFHLGHAAFSQQIMESPNTTHCRTELGGRVVEAKLC